jgi:RNA polymerase sigma factor (sigma-70 family)
VSVQEKVGLGAIRGGNMASSLSKRYNGEDRALVLAACNGSREALDELVRRHQDFIYHLVLRMLWEPQEAEDVTQEILVRIITGLASFRGESSFRTWAYRIATNHVLNWRRGRAERIVEGFGYLGEKIDDLADSNLGEETGTAAERRVLVKETRVACLTGMLLCLDRTQRVVFVVGEIFEASDALGSAILETTRSNYRQRLARARRDLYEFMSGKCGLVDPANPCRCARKTRAAIREGIVDPRKLRFVDSHVDRITRNAQVRSGSLERLVLASYGLLYRDRDIRGPPDMVARLRAILSDRSFRTTLDLDGQPS